MVLITLHPLRLLVLFFVISFYFRSVSFSFFITMLHYLFSPHIPYFIFKHLYHAFQLFSTASSASFPFTFKVPCSIMHLPSLPLRHRSLIWFVIKGSFCPFKFSDKQTTKDTEFHSQSPSLTHAPFSLPFHSNLLTIRTRPWKGVQVGSPNINQGRMTLWW